MSGDPPRVLIIGAGPCGLGCAHELIALGHRNWTLVEQQDVAGGHAGSEVDPAGFTWDQGGHVVFSHFGEFDRILEEVMGDEVFQHERSSYIRFHDTWVPYPFQNNLRYLPRDIAYECLLGLIEAKGGNTSTDFATWMNDVFGPGITKHFMLPYNFKVWATPPDHMQSQWIGERVSVVDYQRALRSIMFEEDDAAWGPNNLFVFPAEGGTGEIYRRLAARMDDNIDYGRRLVRLDVHNKVAHFEDGGAESYDALVSTIPLDRLIAAIVDAPDSIRKAADDLEHNGVYMVGVGYEAPLKDDKSWMYFPEDHAPFYRATNFAKYSPANVPGGDTTKFSAYMTEVSYSPHKPVERSGLEEEVERGLRASGVIEGQPEVASMHVIDIDYAYPVPTLARDAALDKLQPWLMGHNVYSRGRFGSWRYEIGNMDHATKMGVDAARFIVNDQPEELWSV